MMQKIINTMFYGSTKAKLFLWSVFIMILATIFLGVFAVAIGSAAFGVGAVVCGVAAFITSQSASLSELERKAKPPRGGRKKEDMRRKENHADGRKNENIDSGAPVDSKEKARAKARYLASMNEKKMKQLIKEKKIRQKHIFAMIDSYPQEHISQTPVVIWQTDTHLHILALDYNVREFELPLEDIRGIFYQKDVTADPQTDYASFQYVNFISKLYKPYLPTYRESTRDGELVYLKNLFTIEPGISFTNTSMKGIMQILTKVPLLVDDAVNTSQYFDEYFKEVYRYSILCKNDILALEEYRVKMEQVLDALLVAPVTGKEFAKSLRDMNRYHLITSDYVTKYTQIYITNNQPGKPR